jgi:hypothetical protein
MQGVTQKFLDNCYKNIDNFACGHNIFLFFKIHSSVISTFVCTFLQLIQALQESSFLNVVKLPCHFTLNFSHHLKMPPF